MNPDSGFFEIFAYIARRLDYRRALSKSSSWPVVDAILEDARFSVEPLDLAISLTFRYTQSGQQMTTEQRIPRFFYSSTRAAAKRYPVGAPVKIRVDPANSGKAFLIPS